MMLSLAIAEVLSGSQWEWLSTFLATLVKLNVMQAFCP
jgi:hypothetical protein